MMFLKTLLTDPIFFLRAIVIIIGSICLHELAHGFAAISQGDNTPQKSGHITLNPVVHMGWESMIFLCFAGIAWGQMPVNPAKFRSPKLGNMIVSAAGPGANLLLAGLCILLIKLAQSRSAFSLLSFEFLALAASINLMLFLFNLLPVPPLDGFHVLSELIPAWRGLENHNVGYFLLIVLFLSPIGEQLAAVS